LFVLLCSALWALYLLTNEPLIAVNSPNAKTVTNISQPTVTLTPQQKNQTVQNILATADRPLNTSSERIKYVTNYLQNHTQPGICQEKDGCNQEFRQQMEKLAAPCPTNKPQCQKDWKFVADQQELAAVYDQLARSITSEDATETVPSSSNLPTSNELAQASPAPSSSSTIEAPIAPTSQPAPTPNINNIPVTATPPPAKIDYNPDTNRYEIAPPSAAISNESLPNSEITPQNQPLAPSSSPASSNNKTAGLARPGTNSGANNGNNSQMPNEVLQPHSQSNQQSKEAQTNKADKVTPPPRPPKNQWLNFLSVILLVFLLSKVIAEISGDYVAWRYGQQPANEAITQQNFNLFCQLHNSMQSAKLGKNSSKTAVKSTRKT
jgi:hypothetical protein